MKCKGCNADRLSTLGIFRDFPSAAQSFYKLKEDSLKDKKVNLTLFECMDCALVQISTEPVSYFKSVITAASIGKASASSLREEWTPLIEKFIPNSSKVLDVGAGRGDFVRLLRDWGMDAIGLEFNPEIHSDNFLVHGWFPDTRLNATFKLVVCNNFLEHHPAPKEFLSAIYDHLDNNGYLYVSVPRFEYLYQQACFYELVPDHLSYFTKRALFNILENSGFNVLNYYSKNNDNDHVVFCEKRKVISTSEKINQFNSIVESLKDFIAFHKTNGETIAVWGAGHRTLTLLSMAHVNGIEKVIDSAPFKQGLFTPVTGIPIVSPEDYLANPTSVLILMLPGKYSQQVKSFLAESRSIPSTYLFDDSTNIQKIF
jgi:SAM-dependent methyltransferase